MRQRNLSRPAWTAAASSRVKAGSQAVSVEAVLHRRVQTEGHVSCGGVRRAWLLAGVEIGRQARASRSLGRCGGRQTPRSPEPYSKRRPPIPPCGQVVQQRLLEKSDQLVGRTGSRRWQRSTSSSHRIRSASVMAVFLVRASDTRQDAQRQNGSIDAISTLVTMTRDRLFTRTGEPSLSNQSMHGPVHQESPGKRDRACPIGCRLGVT